jgi:predicted RNA polymerase sigma factor
LLPDLHGAWLVALGRQATLDAIRQTFGRDHRHRLIGTAVGEGLTYGGG